MLSKLFDLLRKIRRKLLKTLQVIRGLLARAVRNVKGALRNPPVAKSQRGTDFASYKTGIGDKDAEFVRQYCLSIGNTYRTANLNNPFNVYQELVQVLHWNPMLETRPLCKLMQPLPEGKSAVSIRVDVDGDIEMGLRMARYNARYGFPASFYLLHTAFYYGELRDGVFCRHPAIHDYLYRFIVTGCEIGLHLDPLHHYIEHGVDGAEAVKTELKWLRDQGAKVTGSTAHNSAVVYGAESFEILKGRAMNNREMLVYQDKMIPLQTINEIELGLMYEGNFPVPTNKKPEAVKDAYPVVTDPVRNRDWLTVYLLNNPVFRRKDDVSIWVLSADTWAIADHKTNTLQYPVSFEGLKQFFNSQTAGNRIIITLHPEYFSG